MDHDCLIEYCVHVGPNWGICGGVSIGEGTLLWVGCSVIPGIKIGKWCTIGAGSDKGRCQTEFLRSEIQQVTCGSRGWGFESSALLG
ncbi:MAG: hypothetical protein PHP44_15240 [Kiritimatiellae bacterium]|nr:hypothetical protein [Kiritimatiellia bacterium]